jgi:hypothetical protein
MTVLDGAGGELDCESDDDDPLEHARWLASLRLPRSVDTYEYSGTMLDCVNNTHENESLRWSNLPAWERERRWLYNFRMYEEDFEGLLEMCDPLLNEHGTRKGFRFYSKRTQLLVTLHFLGHAHTLRVVSEKFGLPHNSISRCCILRGIKAIRNVFLSDGPTKNIRWPRAAGA